jgi:hypothetical protein
MDTLRLVVFVGVATLVVAMAAAMRLAWENAGSKTILLATAALVAAAVLFALQVAFELQSSTIRDFIGVEYTVNHSTASVGQWSYADMVRGPSEIEASNWLRTNDAAAFDRNSKAVTSDLAIFSLTSFLAWYQFDWQLQRIQFMGEVMPGMTMTQPGSTEKESTVVTEADLRGQLSTAGNMFAKAPVTVATHKLLLPPNSTLKISAKSVVLENYVCKVKWELQEPFSVVYVDPRTRTVAPMLPSGKQKWETYTQGFKVTVTYFRLHSQRRDISKYQDWTTRLLAESHNWFEERGSTLYQANGVPQ